MSSAEELNTTEDGIKAYVCAWCGYPSGVLPIICPGCYNSGRGTFAPNPNWPKNREVYL